jgi:hypothetical protein
MKWSLNMRTYTFAGLLAIACLPASIHAATYVDIPLTSVRDHTFTADGYLMVTSGNRLVEYDLLTCFSRDLLVADSQLMGVAVSSDDTFAAVAKQGLIDGKVQFHYKRRYGMRHYAPRAFTPYSLEGGTFMPSWTKNNKLLITGSFNGSGWVPLREFEPFNGELVTRAMVTQNSMLAKTEAGLTAIVESNISSGPLRAWDNKAHQILASVNTNWFVYEVAVNSRGTRYVVPTYNGAYVYDLVGSTFVQAGLIGQYAHHGPRGAVFSPDASKLITANWSWDTPADRGIKLLDAQSLQQLASLDGHAFQNTGNHALGEGRLSISPDSHWLAATVGTGVRLYDVSMELTGRYMGGCATQTPAARDETRFGEGAAADHFDAWGWPLDKDGVSTRSEFE